MRYSTVIILLLAIAPSLVGAQQQGLAFCIQGNPDPDDKPCTDPCCDGPNGPGPQHDGTTRPENRSKGPEPLPRGPAVTPPDTSLPYSHSTTMFDPVRMSIASTNGSTEDVFVRGTIQHLVLRRTYSPPGGWWRTTDPAGMYVPRPYGEGYAYAGETYTYHNYFSYVTPVSHVGTLTAVHLQGGRVVRFWRHDQSLNGCGSAPCWLNQHETMGSELHRVLWLGDGYEVYESNLYQLANRYYYGDRWTDGTHDAYLLTEVRSAEGHVLTRITYELPTDENGQTLGCAAPVSPDAGPSVSPGTPWIRFITNGDGSTLSFRYKKVLRWRGLPGGTECVLWKVGLLDRETGTEENLVTYTYWSEAGDGTETGGRISSAAYPSGTNSYIYTRGYLAQWKPAFQQASPVTFMDHVAVSNQVRDAGGLNEDSVRLHWQAVTPYDAGVDPNGLRLCCEATVGGSCGTQTHTANVMNAQGGVGDGGMGVLQRVVVIAETGKYSIDEARMVRYTDSCAGSNSCSPGMVHDEWTCGTSMENPGFESASGDKRGYYTVKHSNPAPLGQRPSLRELSQIDWGAADVNGTDALSSARYTWTYDSSGGQLIDTIKQDSLLDPGDAITKYLYDGTRVKGIIRQGHTKEFDGTNWTTQPRFVGTFYFTHRQCSQDLAQEPYGRTVEVHGPCLVDPGSGFNASDCSTSLQTTYPVTQYEYYDGDPVDAGTGGTNDSYRLRRIVQYPSPSVPSGCGSSSSLAITLSNYDAYGNAQTALDSNGIETSYTHAEGRVTSVQRDGALWTFGYDTGRLTTASYPQGNNEVLCYRTGVTPGGDCGPTRGSWTTKLQWKAKFDSTKSTWSELVAYAYWPNGELKSETSMTNTATGAEIRRKLTFDSDAHRRPTYLRSGEGSGAFTATSLYDGANNLTGIGRAFNSPPPFCEGQTSIQAGTPQSRLCASLWFDGANRLRHLDERPVPGSSASDARTCFEYDAQNNVKKVATGCSASGANGNCGTCSGVAQYQYDDFGSLIEATLPWTDNGAASPGTTRFAYDAAGHLLIKQTPAMSATGSRLSYVYDALGRPLSLHHAWNSPSAGTQLLWELAYDATATIDATCSSSSFVPTNTMGRELKRHDSFGTTWFAYDAFGRVTKEIRLREGTAECQAASNSNTAHHNPHTIYTYSANGNLTSMVYPYGRTVTYVYPTSGPGLDRAERIDVTSHNGTSWLTTTGILSGIVWEPYGGVRGYQTLYPANSTAGSIEYVRGDDGTTSPSSACNSVPFPNSSSSDQTGRTRALWVSSLPTGAYAPGSGNGAVLKQVYRWQADQLVQTNSCLLSQTNARVETYGYDAALRVTAATGTLTTTGGPIGNRGYGYSSRGNLATESNEVTTWAFTHSASDWLDRLTERKSSTSGELAGHRYTYDRDGRVSKKYWPDTSGFVPAMTISFTGGPNSSGSGGFNGASESVLRTATIDGAAYNYFYDAKRRRRLKSYPTGVKDEYFYSLGDRLIVDQGNTSLASASEHPVDEYVLLDGRPVLMIRGKLNGSWSHLSDSTTACNRLGEVSSCGIWHIATDYLGKPVLMLDSQGRVSGTGEYDVFGFPNRVALDNETEHPYESQAGVFGDAFGQPAVSGTVQQQRVRFDYLDLWWTDECESEGDSVHVKDVASGAVLAGPYRYPRSLWTSWFSPGASGSQTVLTNVGRLVWQPECNDLYCSPTLGSCQEDPFGSKVELGAVASAYEYRRFQSGGAPQWTPLRFPGHYYDAETDLFENWNRNYDPSVGRYLQPEPLLQDPRYATARATAGFTAQSYSYAANNPMGYVDPDGRHPVVIGVGVGVALMAYTWWATNDAATKAHVAASQYPSALDGPGDAVRHCVWSCEMNKQMGPILSGVVGQLNEAAGGNSFDQVVMDLSNNRCGRTRSPAEDCAKSCGQALQTKQLRVLNPWSSGAGYP